MNAHCLPQNSTYETLRGYSGGFPAESVAFLKGRERQLLADAILGLAELAREKGYKPISDKSLLSAIAITQWLPTNKALPRVAVDEDGEILMVWGQPQQQFALTIDGETIHMVVNPGQTSTHLDPVIYNGGYLPLQFLANVPQR